MMMILTGWDEDLGNQWEGFSASPSLSMAEANTGCSEVLVLRTAAEVPREPSSEPATAQSLSLAADGTCRVPCRGRAGRFQQAPPLHESYPLPSFLLLTN